MFIELIRVWQNTDDVTIDQKPKIEEEIFLLNLDAVESFRAEPKIKREEWFNSTVHFVTHDGQESVYLNCKNNIDDIREKLKVLQLLK